MLDTTALERVVLGAAMTNGELVDPLLTLPREVLGHPDHRVVYDAIAAAKAACAPVDLLTVGSALRSLGSSALLATEMQSSVASDDQATAVAYLGIIAAEYRCRTIAQLHRRMADRIDDGEDPGAAEEWFESERVALHSRLAPFTIHGPIPGMNREGGVIALWGFEPPPPLEWAVGRIIPEGYVTILAADGGTGKSYLAILVGICVAIGERVLGLETKSHRVLYVDYEVGVDEQKRRLGRVCAGLGIGVDDERLAERFFYLRPRTPLGTVAAQREIMRAIEDHEIGFVILDSLTIGAGGMDVLASKDVTALLSDIGRWGTVLAIDHVSAETAKGNSSRARPYGSVFKRNMARSTLNLARADGGGMILTPDKSNFGPKQDVIGYDFEFVGDGGPVTFSRLAMDDERLAGASAHLSATNTTFHALLACWRETGQPVSLEAIVQWREENGEPIVKGTVRNHLTQLKRAGKVVFEGNGIFAPADSRFTVPIEAVNRESRNGNGKASPSEVYRQGEVARRDIAARKGVDVDKLEY